jgi:uncharacterized membrane protein
MSDGGSSSLGSADRSRPPTGDGDAEHAGGGREAAGPNPAPRGRREVGLGIVLLCLAGTLCLGLAAKAPCASAQWGDGRQYRWLCYSDIVPLLGTEQLATGDRLPFLDPCRPEEGSCDEYPVLTMATMRVAAWMSPLSGSPPARGYAGFFAANAVLLAIAGAATTVALYMMVGRRALYFALAPTLLIYAFTNWDLLAVAFATLATLAYLRRRDVASGILLALGAAAKLFPGLLVVPFALGRTHDRRRVGAVRLVWAAAITWLALNVPFAIFGRPGWWEFFRLNSRRPPDWDSLWYLACQRIPGTRSVCAHTWLVNLCSLVAFVALSVLVWKLRSRREPGFARWTFGFPLLILFLVTNKVYSPQYGLWLLPWFALALPDLPRFLAFEAADVAVFVTRFAFFGQLDPHIGGWVDAFTIGWFQLAVMLRLAALIWCVVGWIRSGPGVAPAVGVARPPPAADLARAPT